MSRTHRRSISFIVVLTLLGLVLRLFWLDESPLRGDEAFAIQYWAAPWPDGLALTAIEPHPYGTFALFALWRALFGDSEWVMRLLPTLLSLPGIAAIAVVGQQAFHSRRAGRIAAFLYAIHPFLIWHAQDARNYAIWATTNVIALALFLKATHRGTVRAWLAYSLAALISAYVFFFDIFFIAAAFCYAILLHRSQWRRWILSGLVIGFGLIPWGLQILTIMQGGEYSGTAGAFNFGQLFTWFLPTFIVGSTLPASIVGVVWPLSVVAILLCGVLVWRSNPHIAVLLACLTAIPVAMLWLASLRMDIFRPRYLIPHTSVMILLLSGVFVQMTKRSRATRLIAGSALVLLVSLFGTALTHHYTDPAFAKAPDWRSLGQLLTSQTESNDLVVQQVLDPAFTYYYRGPAAETSLPLRANPPAEETIGILEAAAREYASIWLIPAEIPWWDAERVPLTWLTNNMQLTTELEYASFRVLRFQPWQVAPDEPRHVVDYDFGTVATLRGWYLDRTGDVLRLTVFWEPLTAEETVHGFAHLVGPARPEGNPPLLAQDDHPVTSSHWEPGMLRRDVYQLALPGAPPSGDWSINFGLYLPQNLERLPVGNSDHLSISIGTDFLSIDQATLSHP